MNRYIFRFINNLKLRWKMLVLVLPLVILPIFVVGGVIGYIANDQAYRGITQNSEDDLDHMASFTLDLLQAHYKQFQVYKKDKQRIIREELKTLTNLAYSMVEGQQHQVEQGLLSLSAAKEEARTALKQVNIGETGYIYAMTTKGDLTVHLAQEGENIFNERDEDGRHFIRTMCRAALASKAGSVLYIIYPWRNAVLGDKFPRKKIVAYRYFPEWDWIIATGGYLEETYNDLAFEESSFNELKNKVKSKRVGQTGYIFCMDRLGTLTVHPDAEGATIFDEVDLDGRHFIREMATRKNGWINYSWGSDENNEPRKKIVRYRYFKPWNWIVAVGAYEDEFYQEANLIKGRIIVNLVAITLIVGVCAVLMVFLAAKVLTDPINHMIGVIRRVNEGRIDQKMRVENQDELGEMATAFNRMTEMIQRHKEMEATLAQQGKMASLGVLSSGVAHEINNPLGVILGYAGYLEGKLDPEDPNHRFIHEIKRESKRCKKIVQDLLSYARTPQPELEPTDLNKLLHEIIDFAANHTDMHHVSVERQFAKDLPEIEVDPDQLRQVAINLLLNAGPAMKQDGRLVVSTRIDEQGFLNIAFCDNGSGIPEDQQEKIFEPFFTTKSKGTGLGLPITRQIVEQHQGRISLESKVGEGTTITVQLPVKREEY